MHASSGRIDVIWQPPGAVLMSSFQSACCCLQDRGVTWSGISPEVWGQASWSPPSMCKRDPLDTGSSSGWRPGQV